MLTPRNSFVISITMEITAASKILESLAQPSRLRVFRLLVPTGAAGISAGEISKKLRIPPATLSFHLTHLTNARLIAARREGRSIYYSLRVSIIRQLLTFLMQDCCQGRPELCGVAPGDCDEQRECGQACAPKKRRRQTQRTS